MTRNQEKLGELLRNWGESHALSSAAEQALRARVAAALRRQECPPHHGSSARPDAVQALPSGAARQDRRVPASAGNAAPATANAWWVFAAAASLLAATALWSWNYVNRDGGKRVSTPARSSPSDAGESPPDFVQLAASQLQEKQTLLAESQRLFAGQVGWIAEVGDRVRIDIAPNDENAPPTKQWLAVRLVVTRQAADGNLCPVWSLDVISSSQHVVRLTEEMPDGADVMLWNYSLPDGMIAVDARLDLPEVNSTPRLQANYTGLQESGVPKALYSWTAGEAEYAVYQTVTAIDDRVL